MRRQYWILFACAVPVYFAVAAWLSFAAGPALVEPDVRGERHELIRPFIPFNSTFAMTSVDPWFGDLADVPGQFDASSPIILYEDDRPLGPAHSTPHSDISTLGHGRFSHWKGNFSTFVFSSSDNTDPRTNGRTYWAVKPPIAKGSGIVPDVSGEKYLLKRPFARFGKSSFAVVAKDEWFADSADTPGQFDATSPVMIYEDGKPLGPAHSTPHDQIGSLGHGRFSHWKGTDNSIFVFSSSDNSDPETNGRDYWVVRPPVKRSGIVSDVRGEEHPPK
ncbi:hypothetical protein JQ615_22365 [Bradyrhizobium jicamae]|uniref:Secreted protein n=1 Tax=Bradyrhizobium jicamae TaxID=280332 RepID=A0ABS5FMV8_9BRAD|nr:hypothetical protein [Bradyrhizobium jicamae]MBR0798139.1 hypothetical protein [Bradyrhizobium jicamae]